MSECLSLDLTPEELRVVVRAATDDWGHTNMSEVWHALPQGQDVDVTSVRRNWVRIDRLSGVLGEAFRGLNPPTFAFRGHNWVPRDAYEEFVVSVSLKCRERRVAEVEREAAQRAAVRRVEIDRKLRAIVASVDIDEDDLTYDGRQGPSFVYFIRGTAGGPIKIGVTTDVARRVRHLQACSPVELIVLRVLPGTVEAERALHKRFADARLHGEWFEPTEQLLAFIEERKAA